MLLLLLYWSYLGFTFLNLGFGFQKISGIKSKNSLLTIVFGMFGATILASAWAIFGRVNIEFQFFLIVLQGFIFVGFRNELFSIYHNFRNEIKALPKSLKILLGFILAFILLNAVSNASLIDNETYYLQTVKWLNEYGFVKGLANLHLFFGQTSGWHILQSAFSFSYVSNNLNHLNGFCLLLGNIFAVFQLNRYFKNKNQLHLSMGLLPVANVMLFAFCKVPSPDLAVMLLSLMLFSCFIETFKKVDAETFKILFILSVFIVYIKITALPIMLLPFVFLGINLKKIIVEIIPSLIIGFFVMVLFVVKNTILTGYPLFPLLLFKDCLHYDYAIPISFYDFSFHRAQCYSFFISSQDYAQSNALQIFLKWLTHNTYNSIMVILIVLMPYFIKRFFNQKAVWVLYGVMLLQLLLLWATSPQYRFMTPFFLLFALLLLSVFLKAKKTIYYLIYTSLGLSFILLILPLKLGQHQQKLTFNERPFSLNRLLYPNQNSNLKTAYHSKRIGNLQYFSPDSSVYIWATGDGELPCINTRQIEYFNKKLHYVPQLRTAALQDGFYAKKTTQP